MTTDDLILYIKKQSKNNVSKNVIISKLLSVGWKQEDVDEAFNIIEKENVVIETEPVAPVELPNEPKITITNTENTESKNIININTENQNYEFIPNLIPKDIVDNKVESPIENTISKDALLSSYYKDVASIEQTNDNKIVNKKSYKKWIILAIVVFIVLGVTYLFVSGMVSLKNINFSFIKKDPRVLLLNNSETLSSLKSYKTETEIKITSPTIANISAALVSGEEISFIDKDYITINNLGLINQNNGNLISDNFLTFKSSLVSDIISTDIKSSSNNIYVSLPDVGLVTGVDTLGAMVVRTDDENSHLIANIFPENVSLKLSKLNLYHILSKSISSYINKDVLTLYNQFINDSDINEKGEENIKGVETHHYTINTDKQVAKNILTKIFENFTTNLSDQDKMDIETIVGSTKIVSFDVWVGKVDNNIYQYKLNISIPLSKILKFEDKSIGDNTVNVSWQTTYYDFDVDNEIIIPKQSTDIHDFLKIVNEVRLKKEVSQLRDYATMLKNMEGSYGVSANTLGSCTKPTSGSLFSPTGHPKKAIDPISSISSFMNKTLTTTNGQGACYSTTKNWSFAIPISDNYTQADIVPSSFYCIDSTGNSKNLESYPKGPLCQ